MRPYHTGYRWSQQGSICTIFARAEAADLMRERAGMSMNRNARFGAARVKEKALARLDEPKTKMRRYRSVDEVLKFLQQL